MAGITVRQIELTDSLQVQDFLELPFRVYHGNPLWVPPLDMDARRQLDARRNPFFRDSQAAFFLAYEGDGRAVARLACLNNRRYNEFNGEASAFFYLFEAFDLPDASGLLFEASTGWARAQGLNKIIGPKGFTPLDGMGLLTEGFEFAPAFGIPYNHPYYSGLVQASGFRPAHEIVSGTIGGAFFMDERIARVAHRVQERRGLKIADFQSKSDLRKLLPRFEELYNSAIHGTVGNYPITREEAQGMAEQLLWFADPGLIKIILKEERPVGFLFAYPDISAALRRCHGKLLPFGWLDLLVALRTTRILNVNGAGMIEEYRGSGGTAILFNEMRKSGMNGRFERAEVVQIGVDNEKMLRELAGVGITFHKKHCVYERRI